MSEIKTTITRTPITVTELRKGKYQKNNTMTAILKQELEVTRTYPSANHSSDLQENMFADAAFNDEDGEVHTNTEIRVAFVDVPDNKSVEQVQANINKDACLYKILSCTPILSKNHHSAISSGKTTKDALADSQAVRYPEDHNETPSELITFNSKVQYRKVMFWNSFKQDSDDRLTGDEFISTNLRNELENGVEVQEEFTMENQ